LFGIVGRFVGAPPLQLRARPERVEWPGRG
jgi:hypothetical protein